MRYCWRAVLVLAFVLAAILPTVSGAAAASGCGSSSGTKLLFRAYRDDGSVADPPMTLMSPDDPAPTPVTIQDSREITTFPGTCRAVVATADGQFVLLDGKTGAATPIVLDPDTEFELHAHAGPWAIFSPHSNVGDYHLAKLLDVRTGDLTPLLPEGFPSDLFTLGFSPGGGHLVVTAQFGDTYIVPTNDWPHAVSINGNSSPFVLEVDSPTDRALVTGYSDGTHDSKALVLVDLAAAEAIQLDTASSIGFTFDAWFVPGHDDEILILNNGRLRLMDLSTPFRTDKFALDTDARPLTFGASGLGALVTLREHGDAPAYLDLDKGTIQPLTGPADEPLNVVTSGDRWVILGSGDATAPSALYSLDLDSGALSPVTPTPEITLDIQAIRSSDDGRITVMTVAAETNQQTYLIDAERGSMTLLAESNRTAGSVAPDGAWAAFSTSEKRSDGSRQIELTLVDVATGLQTSLGPGLDPAWLT